MKTSVPVIARFGLIALTIALSIAIGLAQTNEKTVAIVTANAAIFGEASLTAPALRIAAPGTLLNVVKLEGDWVQVEFSDPQEGRRSGWMQRSSLNLSTQGLQPMDLSVAKPAATPAASPASGPKPPCVILKIYQKKGADAWTRWTVPKPFNYVEGDFPKGIQFRNELADKHIREIKTRGGHVVVLKADYALPDLQDARESCRNWQESANK